MKIRAFALTASLVVSATPAWPAEALPKTLVIADTGFSNSDPVIAAHTVLQVCMLDWNACPNGSNYQESGTAASLTLQQMSSGGFSHGSKMARAAIAAYPDVKLILIRIIAQSSTGKRMSASEGIITKVLNWANTNSKLYGIGAIAISQGSSKLGSNARKCWSSPATEKVLAELKSKGIYSFFPTGNEAKTDAINWPACMSDSVAVGALNQQGEIATYSNYAIGQVDIYEPGFLIDTTTAPLYSNENGTSYSAQYAAAKWLALINEFPKIRPSLIYWEYILSGDVVWNNKEQTGWSGNYDIARAVLKNSGDKA